MDRTFSIKTLGCKLNQYESALIADRMAKRGWRIVPFGEPADLVIVNTCTVTDKSDKKCRNYIRQASRLAREGRVVVTGCMAESPAGFPENLPGSVRVVKNSGKGLIPSMADGAESALDNDGFDSPMPLYRTRAYLKIQDGCGGNCSYCIVPSVRGLPSSRPYGEIMEHARMLAGSGVPEIVLTGITIGKYADSGRDLADLVEGIISIPGDYRLRITSIEPGDVSGRLLDLYSDAKICRHIHVPLQSGSDRVLAAMNRPYGRDFYLETIGRIRARNRDIAVGTDIIVGFPGEDGASFSETLETVGLAGFSYVHQFSFSPRSGTPAASLAGTTPRAETEERSKRLRDLAAGTGLEYRRRFVGTALRCVIERKGRALVGVSDNYLKIRLAGGRTGIDPGSKFHDVILDSAEKNGCLGRPVV
ncbi:MAG: MiaB/RimO family radical SAM methylthiotransferase [Spirochaetes bacterium]|jgi:threonylcarbamoyladenosine tRNA methylthiotransferase MtaB|nr:MiaB/RimO family radical SAM methylthiotransferase [Spirochaetota bacterium]